jgi:hypothetical protein
MTDLTIAPDLLGKDNAKDLHYTGNFQVMVDSRQYGWANGRGFAKRCFGKEKIMIL